MRQLKLYRVRTDSIKINNVNNRLKRGRPQYSYRVTIGDINRFVDLYIVTMVTDNF